MLIHRVSGVVNLAQGALAMAATYLYVELARELRPSLSLALAVGAATVAGLVAHALVFRPVASAPALAGVVASVGLLAVLQATATLVFGTDSRAVPAVLPARPVHVAGLTVPADRLLLATVVTACGILLWAVGRFTRVGLAARAAAADRTSLALLGWSPDALAAGSWAVAGALAALAGILAGPVTALDPTTSSLLVIPALAAAVVGRMSSFGLTVAAGLALGAVQSELVLLQQRHEWLPRSGLRESLPFLVIVAGLALGGGRRLDRSAAPSWQLPRAGEPRHPLAAAAVLVAVATGSLVAVSGGDRLSLVNSLIAVVLCLSLVVLTGYAGQVSLAQMAFAGIAGFSLAGLAGRLELSLALAVPLAVAAAAAAGVVVSLPALRLRGVSLAVVTLAAAVAVEDLLFRSSALGGVAGAAVPGPVLGGPTALPFGLGALGAAAAAGLGVVALRRGRLGRRFLAVRADDRAARAVGVDASSARVAACALSAALAGVGGVLLGLSQGQLSFGSFGVLASLSLLAVAYVGGIATVAGAVVGGLLVADGVVFRVLDRLLGLGPYQLLAGGLGLVAVAVLRPDGLAGTRRPRRSVA